ncbi:hypothetical protein [Fructilactobacillus frigidiflavus]|uniref:hypothetical protein n=1 Tax=Fructilactobacillus frigidiflavus TaxID=3242688 RepID=UPI0037581FA9
MKFKKSLLVSLCMLFVIALSGCKNFSAHDSGKDYLKIYDANNQIVKTIDGPKGPKLVPDVQGELHKEAAPQDAKVSYKYVSHERNHNLKITITAYSNYKIAKVQGVPVVGNGIVHLNQAQFDELNHPNNLEKNNK